MHILDSWQKFVQHTLFKSIKSKYGKSTCTLVCDVILPKERSIHIESNSLHHFLRDWLNDSKLNGNNPKG